MIPGRKTSDKIKLIFLVLKQEMKNEKMEWMQLSCPFAQKKGRIIVQEELALPDVTFASAKIKKAFTKAKEKGRPIAGKLI